MKDYYQIIGVPENAGHQEIKRAFRKLAFKYHPDTNPGNEKRAEERFKEINEAYAVLGDKAKRQQFNFARKERFAGYGGFQYSQQDIFQEILSNQPKFDELSRMFAQAGLRFDQDFLNRVFFEGRGVIFQFYTGPGGISPGAHQQYPGQTRVSTYKPSWIERFLSRAVAKLSRYLLGKLFGIKYTPLPKQNLDQHIELELTSDEASTGGEKKVTYKRGKYKKRLMIRIPAGVKPGTKIRLKGMGLTEDKQSGDLYLHIKVKE